MGALIAVALLCCSCAVGKAGDVCGVAVGQASIRSCEARAEGEPLCDEIRGGALSEQAKGLLERAQDAVKGLLGIML